ncbi:MAG TPA: chitobiase/beta-hexosaminidase C-terminal domain-containing protein [Terracidiphilus sp.]|nr:chitobiase/beta-hexosaminidase C-terminal domain-containing protein [Terracidiphilus sp.]
MNRHSSPYPQKTPFILNRIACCLVAAPIVVFMANAAAQSARQMQFGIAWHVRGTWRAEEKSTPIRAGDAIQPGSLLLPDPSDSDHSVSVLLPDGQSILCECFTAQDCSRGFRVPPLAVKPDDSAIAMIARIRAVIAKPQQDSQSSGRPNSQLPQDEAVAVLGPGNSIQIGGLASRMQNGRYTYEVHDIGQARPGEPAHTLDKLSSEVTLVVPGPGLYSIRFTDSLEKPRIDLLVAAIHPSDKATVMEPFEEAHQRFLDWKEDGLGWPTHDFQRALLKSLVLNIKPGVDRPMASGTNRRPGVTAQPQFEPRPGISKGNMQISLQSDTSGAVIHFTVDGSQPFLTSPVYRAPIVMKRVPITIKAFATAPDKKDSPVVTGVFRVER